MLIDGPCGSVGTGKGCVHEFGVTKKGGVVSLVVGIQQFHSPQYCPNSVTVGG